MLNSVPEAPLKRIDEETDAVIVSGTKDERVPSSLPASTGEAPSEIQVVMGTIGKTEKIVSAELFLGNDVAFRLGLVSRNTDSGELQANPNFLPIIQEAFDSFMKDHDGGKKVSASMFYKSQQFKALERISHIWKELMQYKYELSQTHDAKAFESTYGVKYQQGETLPSMAANLQTVHQKYTALDRLIAITEGKEVRPSGATATSSSSSSPGSVSLLSPPALVSDMSARMELLKQEIQKNEATLKAHRNPRLDKVITMAKNFFTLGMNTVVNLVRHGQWQDPSKSHILAEHVQSDAAKVLGALTPRKRQER